MGLQQDIVNQPVSSLPIAPGVMVPGQTPVRQAVAQMRSARQGCVVVVDADGKPEGKFTEHQLARLLVDDPSFLDQPVERFTRTNWACIRHSEPIANVIHKLQTYRLRFVIVVDDDGKAIGVTGQKGLMEYMAEHFPRQVKVQQMEAKVAMDNREGA